MKIQCDACEKAAAVVICCADEAALCEKCDVQIHAANKLASKHQRLPLHSLSNKLPSCDICQPWQHHPRRATRHSKLVPYKWYQSLIGEKFRPSSRSSSKNLLYHRFPPPAKKKKKKEKKNRNSHQRTASSPFLHSKNPSPLHCLISTIIQNPPELSILLNPIFFHPKTAQTSSFLLQKTHHCFTIQEPPLPPHTQENCTNNPPHQEPTAAMYHTITQFQYQELMQQDFESPSWLIFELEHSIKVLKSMGASRIIELEKFINPTISNTILQLQMHISSTYLSDFDEKRIEELALHMENIYIDLSWNYPTRHALAIINFKFLARDLNELVRSSMVTKELNIQPCVSSIYDAKKSSYQDSKKLESTLDKNLAQESQPLVEFSKNSYSDNKTVGDEHQESTKNFKPILEKYEQESPIDVVCEEPKVYKEAVDDIAKILIVSLHSKAENSIQAIKEISLATENYVSSEDLDLASKSKMFPSNHVKVDKLVAFIATGSTLELKVSHEKHKMKALGKVAASSNHYMLLAFKYNTSKFAANAKGYKAIDNRRYSFCSFNFDPGGTQKSSMCIYNSGGKFWKAISARKTKSSTLVFDPGGSSSIARSNLTHNLEDKVVFEGVGRCNDPKIEDQTIVSSSSTQVQACGSIHVHGCTDMIYRLFEIL